MLPKFMFTFASRIKVALTMSITSLARHIFEPRMREFATRGTGKTNIKGW